MFLTIDIGNSRNKIAFFKDNELVRFRILESLKPQMLEIEIDSAVSELKIGLSAAIISSVIKDVEDFGRVVKKYCETIFFNRKTFLPVNILYRTYDTLGKDRIAGVVGAHALYPGKNSLVIDIGTAMTFDFINSKADYLGGSISPGIRMRLKALNTFTDKLPLIYNIEQKFQLIGDTTETSILSGVLNGMTEELNGIIERYQDQYNVEKILLTGGDLKYFAEQLKSNIFAVPNLVLIGLNKILENNVKK